MSGFGHGRAAIVTRASRGIGAAISGRLAVEGFGVVVGFGSDAAAAEAVAAAIRERGGDAVAVGGDVARAKDVARLFDEAEARFGGLDVLFNNAGVMPPMPLVGLPKGQRVRSAGMTITGRSAIVRSPRPNMVAGGVRVPGRRQWTKKV